MATVRTSEPAKANEKHFVWLLLFLLLLLQRIALTLRILYARRPPPLSEATRDPTEAERSKTNNKIKPLSIASQLRYVSMYEHICVSVCVNALCAMVVVVANAKSKKEDEV